MVVIPLALLAAALAGTAWWLVSTTSGLRTLFSLSGPLTGIRIAATGVDGSLRAGFTAATLSIDGANWSVRIDSAAIEPRNFDPARRIVHLERVAADQVVVSWQAGESEQPARVPDDLGLPVDLVIGEARITRLQLQPPAAPAITLTDLQLAARANAREIVVDQLRVTSAPTQASLQGRMQAQPPFELSVKGTLSSTLQAQDVGGRFEASGTVTALQVEFDAGAEPTRARGVVELQPFAPVPLARASIDINDFDPAAWFEGAPSMKLTAKAELQPVDGAPGFSVAGPVTVSNALAGPIDRERVPVSSARGTLDWRDDRLNIELSELALPRGRAAGRLTWNAASGIEAAFKFTGVDASAIHTQLQATQANGELRYTLRDERHRFTGSATNLRAPQIAAEFDLTLANRVLDIATARLRLADGRAELTGRVELQGRYATRASGTFAALDLGTLVPGLDTRLNGKIEVDARLRPALEGNARVELSDSRIAGRPLEGRAVVRLENELVDADVDVASGTARLTAQGGLGGGRELNFTLTAPKLAEVAPPLTGSVEARGTVTGTIEQPRLDAQFSASNLAWGDDNRIDAVTGKLAGGLAPDAPLTIDARLGGHRNPAGPQFSLAEANLVARGSTRRHTLELAGNTVAGEPLALKLEGGWADRAWQGTLASAQAGAPFDLQLREPASVRLSATSMVIGPAQFELRAINFTDVLIQRDNGRWRTEGNFAGFQPQDFDARTHAPRRAVRGTAVDRVPLTLAGRWQFDVGDAVTGIAVIERTAGDVYAGIGALTPIGISDIGIAVSILNNRATGNAYLRGTSLGSIDAVIDAWVEPMAGLALQLAQKRPFRIDIDAKLPDLAWVSPLVGDNVDFGGAATARIRVSGTPEDPTASGTITGEGLRLASVEIGVRLENGVLDAVLDEGVLVVNDLIFTGAPRARPTERRAAEDIKLDTPGRLRAFGRMGVRSLTGSFAVQAEQLPVLQRSDRWLVVSGRGGVIMTPTRVDISADLRADGAYINFDALRGPRQLPGDVVVVRAPADQRAPPPAPVAVYLQVNGDLGPRFYIRGAGLEARLAGELRVDGRPGGLLLAQGSVRTVDGQYAAYGQRLQIERGIVTFQGALDNPALNVLAVRPGLPVEVGVAVGGSALQPVVRLHSSPSMPDIEKLNWLVLGRPIGGETGQERALLTAAATALFAGQTEGTGDSVLRNLGIDEISLRPGHGAGSLMPRETVAGTLRAGSATAPSEVVAIGRRITDDLYVTFEQALSGAEYYVALNYQISQRLSLIARAGSTSAIDLVYSFTFD
jgi:translocation and assembly module TamB